MPRFSSFQTVGFQNSKASGTGCFGIKSAAEISETGSRQGHLSRQGLLQGKENVIYGGRLEEGRNFKIICTVVNRLPSKTSPGGKDSCQPDFPVNIIKSVRIGKSLNFRQQ